GFYHARSQIALRMLTWGTSGTHGSASQPINENFFRERLARAVAWRTQLFGNSAAGTTNATDATSAISGATNAYRLVHAEGDELSGLIVERFAEWIAIEIFSLAIYQRIEMIKRLLTELTGVTKFVVRADDRIEQVEGFHVDPQWSDPVSGTLEIVESGLRFRVDLQGGHKTGFFADQRENRRRLASLAAGADLLDVCCYTGGFGIYAKTLGGAASVTGVDLDEDAAELARKNANLNQARIKYVHADAFGYLRQMQTSGHKYDIVVLDPPKFVSNRDEFAEGSRKYNDLNTLGIMVLKPGGLLVTCSCSGSVARQPFLDIVKASAHRAGRPLQMVDQTGAGPDHPIMANCPESEYLKVVWARVL
ncbi:MAG: class I SAM-dependent rRNA methyltransferase, partial [Phycisphaerae bacterium]|nr:class I SAM-dependent rRNA methyltransferase [Phycisphaerae bacterium]